MPKDHDDRDVIVIERGGGGAFGPVLFGALLGVAVGLLFAPRTGAETRQLLAKKLRQAKGLAEDAVEQVGDKISERIGTPGPSRDERRAEARSDLERRLSQARARRRRVAEEDTDEEPVG